MMSWFKKYWVYIAIAISIGAFWFFKDFLNDNSQALMVLITAIYVIATINISNANIKSAEATREQIIESKQQFEESKRLETMPFLQLEIPIEQTSPLFEIELDLCDGERTDVMCKIVKLKNLGNGTATNISYDWERKRARKSPHDYQPINALMEGDSYNFQLSFNLNDTLEGIAYGALIWRFDDLLGNSYEQRVVLEFDEGDLTSCDNDTPTFLGVVKYGLAKKVENIDSRGKEKDNG